jgi:hypothetical protein
MVLPFFDTGAPFVARYDDDTGCLTLSTHLCDGCGLLHLDGTEDLPGATASGPPAPLAFRLDPRTREIEADNDAARAYLESPRGEWLRGWVRREWEALHGRYERLAEQRDDTPPDSRRAPVWQPGRPVPHREVFPYDFTPSIACAGETWLIDDASCIDPSYAYDEVVLACHGAQGNVVEVAGKLGERRGRTAEKVGRALWDAIRTDPALLDRLETRSEEVRAAGPFIMAAAYEQARVETRAELQRSLALDPEGGYLLGGRLSASLLRRFWAVAARLYRERERIEPLFPDWFRVEARGAVTREAWGTVLAEPCLFSLFADPEGDRPLLELAVETRAMTSLAHRRQRLASGLPLIGGRFVPSLTRGREEDGPADADDTRLCIAVVAAVLTTATEIRVDDLPEDGAERVFEHRVEVDGGLVEVRIVFPSAAERPPEEDEAPASAEEDEDDEDDEPLDLEGDPAGPAREAYTDELLDQGASDDEVTLVRLLLRELGLFAEELGEREPWYANACVERFLSDRLPKEIVLGEAQIEETPKALDKLAGWLEEMGHTEAKPLRLTVDRVAPLFRKRARDPRFFSTTKTLHLELLAAGISPRDEAAATAYLDAKKTAPKEPAPAVARSTTRWQPAPGEKAPAPTDPCGCGSGRRYKKCCMPR